MSCLVSGVISAAMLMISSFSGSLILTTYFAEDFFIILSIAADLLDCSATIVMHVTNECLSLLTYIVSLSQKRHLSGGKSTVEEAEEKRSLFFEVLGASSSGHIELVAFRLLGFGSRIKS